GLFPHVIGFLVPKSHQLPSALLVRLRGFLEVDGEDAGDRSPSGTGSKIFCGGVNDKQAICINAVIMGQGSIVVIDTPKGNGGIVSRRANHCPLGSNARGVPLLSHRCSSLPLAASHRQADPLAPPEASVF